MVLLPGDMSPSSGTPTPFSLKMRPWLLFVFMLLGVVAIARFVSFDVTGGFLVAMTVLVGWYATREGFNVAWILCLAVILFLNAMFDAFVVVAYAARVHGHVFGAGHTPWQVNLVRAVLIAGPIVELVGALLCWTIYKATVVGPAGTPYEEGVFSVRVRLSEDYPVVPPEIGAVMCWKIYKEHVSLLLPEQGFEDMYAQGFVERLPQNGSGYGAADVSGRPVAAPSANTSAGAGAGRQPSQQQQQSFEAFQGQGYRLSD